MLQSDWYNLKSEKILLMMKQANNLSYLQRSFSLF